MFNKFSNVERWDYEKINLLFSKDEAKYILFVPVVQEDRLIWNEERDELYSVHFKYCELMETMRSGLRVEKFWRDFVEFKLHLRLNIWCGKFVRKWSHLELFRCGTRRLILIVTNLLPKKLQMCQAWRTSSHLFVPNLKLFLSCLPTSWTLCGSNCHFQLENADI
jgi:hypothetical protein